MTLQDVVASRDISEILHFTPHHGLLGTLHSGFVKSRKRLPSEMDLQHIYKPNAVFRKDKEWLDYVNLSVSSINVDFFRSSCRWHREEDLWWCVLSFDPEILRHKGVVFTTTNNMYTSVRRATGSAGLEAMFAERVERWGGNEVHRRKDALSYQPTCSYAEVLYPQELSTEYLRKIYVQTVQDQDEVYAQLGLVGHAEVNVIVKPSIFESLT